MDEELQPLDAEELMDFSERIERLPAEDAQWAGRLFQECLRARMREADLLEGAAGEGGTLTAETANNNNQVTEAHFAQVALDTAEWLKTLWNVGYMGAGAFPSQPRTAFPVIGMEDVLKSSLFARIREGKRPLPFPPPTRDGLPWHELIEGPDKAHMVSAELVYSDGEPIGAVVEGCADWRVIGKADKEDEYIVQYRGLGPFFQLGMKDAFSGTLRRQPPQWVRTIRVQDRAGVRSYTLIWPSSDGARTREVPLPTVLWERAESEAAYWVATNHPEMYGRVRFELLTE